MLFHPDCFTLIRGAPRLVVGAPRLVFDAPRHLVNAPRLVVDALRLVVDAHRYYQACRRRTQSCRRRSQVRPGTPEGHCVRSCQLWDIPTLLFWSDNYQTCPEAPSDRNTLCWCSLRDYHSIALVLGTILRTIDCVYLQLPDGNHPLTELQALQCEPWHILYRMTSVACAFSAARHW